MDKRELKRQRFRKRGPSEAQLALAEFVGLRCSESSLIQIARKLRNRPDLLDKLERQPLRDAVEAFGSHLVKSPIILTLCPDSSFGAEFSWDVADLGLVLPFFAKHSSNFRSLLREAYSRKVPFPDDP